MQPPVSGIKMVQIGEQIERSESLAGPTGRFDGFVPLMLHPRPRPSPSLPHPPPPPHPSSSLILTPFRPFATVACKYERSFIRTESNSPNNVFLPSCSSAAPVQRWRFPPLGNVPPFLSLLRWVGSAGVEQCSRGRTKKGTRATREYTREERPPTINVYGAAPSFFPFYVVS